MKTNSINPKTGQVSNISFVSKAVDDIDMCVCIYIYIYIHIYIAQQKISHLKNINDIVNRVLISTLMPALMERC